MEQKHISAMNNLHYKKNEEYVSEILSPDYYNSSYHFNFDNIKKLIQIHKERYYNPELLWSLVMMQIFLKSFKL